VDIFVWEPLQSKFHLLSKQAMRLSGPLLCIGAVLLPSAQGNAFLGRDLPNLNLEASNLLEELERVLGSSHKADAEARAVKLEERMRSTFLALPRDAHDRLEPAAVRYLLHRFFVDRHGWYVLGFDAEGEAWNSSSPTAVLGAHAGAEAQEVFDEQLSHGLSLHEVSLLAATLESFVHMETVQRLHDAYRVLGLSAEAHASEHEVVQALDTYMLLYVLGLNHSATTAEEVNTQWKDIEEIYPTWHETQKWIHEVRKEVVSPAPEARTAFETTLRVVEEIGDRYGRWQDQECVQLKDSLLKYELRDTGRVPLSTFYDAALKGQWQFSESQNYLRQLGSLDESDAAHPGVIIANYVNSPTNCVASSKFYSVCCINECEALLGHLERTLTAPRATPERIIEVIEKLPSATVEAPRVLPAQLRARLDEIAAHHDGHVPFHARLFNQWLHHAYPRECPYPHVSGTSKPIAPERWMEHTGESAEADLETMRWHVEEASKRGNIDGEFMDELPWSGEEEFFVSHPAPAAAMSEQASVGTTIHRGLSIVAMASAASMMLMRLLSTAKEVVSAPAVSKVYV